MTDSEEAGQLTALLTELYGDGDAYRWLTTPQNLLDNRKPLHVIADGGIADVLLLLRQIDEGTFM